MRQKLNFNAIVIGPLSPIYNTFFQCNIDLGDWLRVCVNTPRDGAAVLVSHRTSSAGNKFNFFPPPPPRPPFFQLLAPSLSGPLGSNEYRPTAKPTAAAASSHFARMQPFWNVAKWLKYCKTRGVITYTLHSSARLFILSMI
jgi:hypothetical protein